MAEKGYKRRPSWTWAVLFLAILLFAGCSGKDDGNMQNGEQEEEAQQQETAQETDPQLYILLYSNSETGRVFLQGTEDGRQEEFEYNGGTYIYGRYNDSLTMSDLKVGELLKLTYTEKKVLTKVEIATDAFFYEGVTDFTIDEERSIVSARGSNYYYDEDLKIFSEDGIISLNDLSSQDEICMRGMDKEILTIVVTRGHGTLVFKNTALFEGGMASIGNVAAMPITPDLVIEIPEGKHTLSVANEGYGGSKEITITRFEELIVDLDTMKGDGPQYGRVKIDVTPTDAKVTIDGGAADCSQVLEMKYGTYRLKAEAEGYQTWSGKMVVSSKEAAFSITLDEQLETE